MKPETDLLSQLWGEKNQELEQFPGTWSPRFADGDGLSLCFSMSEVIQLPEEVFYGVAEKVLALVLGAKCLQQDHYHGVIRRICPICPPYRGGLVQADDGPCGRGLLYV